MSVAIRLNLQYPDPDHTIEVSAYSVPDHIPALGFSIEELLTSCVFRDIIAYNMAEANYEMKHRTKQLRTKVAIQWRDEESQWHIASILQTTKLNS